MKLRDFDFIKNKKICFSISIAIIALSILISVFLGVKVDIEFQGGAILSYSYTGEIEKDAIEKIVEDTIGERVTLQLSKDVQTGNNNITVSVAKQGITSEEHAAISMLLQSAYPQNNFESLQISNVDSTIGREFFAKSLVAVAFASILMILYIAFRFKRISGWSAGVMAVVALIHDVLIVYAVFVIFRLPINANFMAVLLTILGYSINDTIVIYDRIRENKRAFSGKSLAELVNYSTNQSITRAINTTVATVLALLVVVIVANLYGVTTIVSFAFPMIIGMISGVYSSTCIVGPLWVTWQEYKEKKHGGLAKA